jgi:hypothetical protein
MERSRYCVSAAVYKAAVADAAVKVLVRKNSKQQELTYTNCHKQHRRVAQEVCGAVYVLPSAVCICV